MRVITQVRINFKFIHLGVVITLIILVILLVQIILIKVKFIIIISHYYIVWLMFVK